MGRRTLADRLAQASTSHATPLRTRPRRRASQRWPNEQAMACMAFPTTSSGISIPRRRAATHSRNSSCKRQFASLICIMPSWSRTPTIARHLSYCWSWSLTFLSSHSHEAPPHHHTTTLPHIFVRANGEFKEFGLWFFFGCLSWHDQDGKICMRYDLPQSFHRLLLSCCDYPRCSPCGLLWIAKGRL